MKNIEVVAAIITNKDNKVFCAQRKDYGELALKWEFPGGKIEVGETHQAALTRELKEELELDVEVHTLLMTVKHQYTSFHLTMHTYYCSIIGGTIAMNEHAQYKWVSLDELHTLDWAEADIPIVIELIKRG
jgi:8-oxo-dGTP diphosphatase